MYMNTRKERTLNDVLLVFPERLVYPGQQSAILRRAGWQILLPRWHTCLPVTVHRQNRLL